MLKLLWWPLKRRGQYGRGDGLTSVTPFWGNRTCLALQNAFSSMLTSNTMKRNQQKNNWATTAMKKGGHENDVLVCICDH